MPRTVPRPFSFNACSAHRRVPVFIIRKSDGDHALIHRGQRGTNSAVAITIWSDSIVGGITSVLSIVRWGDADYSICGEHRWCRQPEEEVPSVALRHPTASWSSKALRVYVVRRTVSTGGLTKIRRHTHTISLSVSLRDLNSNSRPSSYYHLTESESLFGWNLEGYTPVWSPLMYKSRLKSCWAAAVVFPSSTAFNGYFSLIPVGYIICVTGCRCCQTQERRLGPDGQPSEPEDAVYCPEGPCTDWRGSNAVRLRTTRCHFRTVCRICRASRY